MPYDPVYISLTVGATVMTFNTRPGEIDYEPQALIGEAQIPGSNQSVVQNLGHGGWRIGFRTEPWNATGITLAGATDGRGIVIQLATWFRAGTVLEFDSDFIWGVNAGEGINVKIVKCAIKEVPGVARNYIVELVLQEYIAGSAI